MVWIILIGFTAGLMARLISPGRNKLSGFMLTSGLGILGAIGLYQLGLKMGFYRQGEGAGLLAAMLGATTVLLICWGAYSSRSGKHD